MNVGPENHFLGDVACNNFTIFKIQLKLLSVSVSDYLLSVLDSNPGTIFNNITQTCAIPVALF